MALPGSASAPAVDRRRDDLAYESGRAVVHLLELGIRPRQIMTKEAFENAIAVVMALGGSTNAVLHLLAIAHEARVDLDLDDFNRVGRRVPHIADTKPHGRYHMIDIDRIGGMPVVMRELLEAGLMHGDCLTVTGRTLAENLAAMTPGPRRRGHPSAVRPIHVDGGIAILRGSLAPEGAVVKVAGIDVDASTARPGSSTARTGPWRPSWPGRIQPGHGRGHPLRGPEGRARHAGDAGRHRGHEGRRPGRRLRPADRRPVFRRHPRVLHRPRGPRGGRRRPDRLRRRRRPHRDRRHHPVHRPGWWMPASSPGAGPTGSCPSPATRPGVLAKYAKLVTGAERGAVTEP